MARSITIPTSDGVLLAADVYDGAGDGPQALLLHMMPATKESWRDFAQALLDRGFSRVLAVDLRGHGGSVQGPRGASLDYRSFSDSDHQGSVLDVAAGMRWLCENGGSADRIAIAGASIGANLAIRYAADHHDTRAVVALSPGLDYRGLTTADAVGMFGADTALLLAASDEDARSSDADRELKRIRPAAETEELSGAGHGTTMFERDADFMRRTADWLARRMR